MPRVTIILTTFNRLNYLKKAINSVLNQTFKDFDLFILDNASLDGTDAYIRSLRDERINYLRNPKNIGAMNNGLKAFDLIRNSIKSEFISFFHDDDMMKPHLLESEIKIFKSHQDVVLVATNTELIDEKEKTIQKKSLRISHDILIEKYKYIEDLIKGKYAIFMPTVMLQRSFLSDNDFHLRPEIGPSADTFLWFEMNLLPHKFYLIHEPLLRYRIHNNQDSQINSFKMREPFYKGAIKMLIENNLKYLIAPLTKYVNNGMVVSLSKQLCQKKISKSQYIKTIEYINKNISEERVNVKIKTIICIAKFSPETLRAIFYLTRIIHRLLDIAFINLAKGTRY